MGKTVTRSNDYATARLATDAAEVVKNVGLGPAIVVGHSMGGRVAQLVALDHPETVKASGPRVHWRWIQIQGWHSAGDLPRDHQARL